MAKATHRVGFRHFTYGEWREPGTLVDASTWPNRLVMEQQGMLHPLTKAELEAGLEAGAEPKPKAPPKPKKGKAAKASAPVPVAPAPPDSVAPPPTPKKRPKKGK